MNRKIAKSFSEEGRDLLRGAAGGLVFGLPILFTMEIWFRGLHFPAGHLLGILSFAMVVNVAFSYASGLRAHNKEHTIAGALADATTALGLGLVTAAAVLALIGQLRFDESATGWLGKIVIEGAAISLGVTFTNRKFPRGGEHEKKNNRYAQLEKAPLSREQKQARLDFYNMAAVLGGAVVFSFNIAPTEEIVMIAAGRSAGGILLLLLAEVAVCYIILYASQFKEGKVFKKTPMQAPAAEVAMTVAMSLAVAAILLLLVGEMEALHSLYAFVAATVTLGFAAVIGGAAGKLVV